MPQFDYISFLNQIFWLLFFFFNFYFFITFFFLPNLCKILKFRKKKIYLNNLYLQKLKYEISLKTDVQNNTKFNIFSNFNGTMIKLTNKLVIESPKKFNFKVINNLVQFYLFKNILIHKI